MSVEMYKLFPWIFVAFIRRPLIIFFMSFPLLTYVKLGTIGRWVGSRTGAGVTATLRV